MGQPTNPKPVTPVVAAIFGKAEYLNCARPALEALLGPMDMESEDFPFDKTAYYADEMGASLVRRFLVYRRLADPLELVGWKHATNRMEADAVRELSQSGVVDVPRRPVNLDVGFIDGSRLVLASAKDFAHRIYIGQGIHAEVTMNYTGGAWLKHRWTFPDFASGMYDAFLSLAREGHLRKAGVSPPRI